MITESQKQQMRADQRVWESAPAPCGIPHCEIYNPCLPERDDESPVPRLWCSLCGLPQRLQISC